MKPSNSIGKSRGGPFSSPLRHARSLRMSILLLQLLCLPPCCVPVDTSHTAASDGNDADTHRERHASILDSSLENQHNLRATKSSSTGRSSFSLMGALYTLLGTTDSHHNDPFPIDDKYEAAAASPFDQAIIGTRREESGNWADNLELSGNDRRLASSDMAWYVDWVNAQCVQSCDPRTTTNPNCAGLALRENFIFTSADICCKTMIPWKASNDCTRVGSPDGTLNQVYQDLSLPVNDWENSMNTPPVNNIRPPANTITPVNDWGNSMNTPPVNNIRPPANTITPVINKPPQSSAQALNGSNANNKPSPSNQVGLPRPQKTEIAPKSSCWRSGMSCASEAQKFACCGVCRNGVCI